MSRKNALLLFSSLILAFQSGYAQWTADSSTFVRVCQATNDQKYPEMVSDGAGGAIIVWQDARDGSTKIYVQRLDSSGIPCWQANGIVVSTAADSKIPNIASDGVGGAIITWFDLRNVWPNGCVAVQRVSHDGVILWQSNGISLSDTASAWAYPEIAGYGNGGAVITWVGKSGQNYAQKIDTSGAIQWASGGVLLTSNGTAPQIAIDQTGGAYITSYHYGPDENYTDVFTQHVSSSGMILGLSSGDTICAGYGYQLNPRLTSDGNGGTIISWLDGRIYGTNYPYAQHVGPGGEILWATNGLKIATTNAYYWIPIVSDGNGGAIFTWLGGNSADVYVQRINGNGESQWGFDIKLTEGTSPAIPMIISDGAHGAFVLWENPGEGKVKLQHVLSDGTLSFGASGKTVSIGKAMYGYFSMCTDGLGKAIVAWEDTPSYTTDIYAERVIVPDFATGIAANDPTQLVPHKFTLNQNFPNPFNPVTTITFTLAKNDHAALIVFDVLGRKVATLVDANLNAGTVHHATFDATHYPSGIYFYRLETGKDVVTKQMMLLK